MGPERRDVGERGTVVPGEGEAEGRGSGGACLGSTSMLCTGQRPARCRRGGHTQATGSPGIHPVGDAGWRVPLRGTFALAGLVGVGDKGRQPLVLPVGQSQATRA